MTFVTHQQVDLTRPHSLETKDVRRSMQLTYRYLDTDEEIIVPNVSYNRCFEYNQQALLDSARFDDTWASMIESGEAYCHPFTRQAEGSRLRRRAAATRATHQKHEEEHFAALPRNATLETTS